MIRYHADTNVITTTGLENRIEGEISRAFALIYDKLVDQGNKPKCHILDTECSDSLKIIMENKNLDDQLAHLHIFQRVLTERVIKISKEHCVSNLLSIYPSFPIHLWYRLLKQAKIKKYDERIK